MSNEVEVKVSDDLLSSYRLQPGAIVLSFRRKWTERRRPSVRNGVTSANEDLLLFVFDLGSFAKRTKVGRVTLANSEAVEICGESSRTPCDLEAEVRTPLPELGGLGWHHGRRQVLQSVISCAREE